jgi:DNA-binding NarL/FixJ family response regulator
MPDPVRLLLVEDSTTLGEALLLAFSFEEGIETVGLAPTISRALEMVAVERPDVVLMDVRLPDGNGIDATAQIVALAPDTAVIIATAHGDHLLALPAADAGAAGFLLKDVRIGKVVDGVRRVIGGGVALDPTVLGALVAAAADEASAEPAVPGSTLSPFERDALALLADGLDGQAIAARLGAGESEVAGAIAGIRIRLGARSNLEAVVRAARAGLVDGVSDRRGAAPGSDPSPRTG